jgi:hypothetical protein
MWSRTITKQAKHKTSTCRASSHELPAAILEFLHLSYGFLMECLAKNPQGISTNSLQSFPTKLHCFGSTEALLYLNYMNKEGKALTREHT